MKKLIDGKTIEAKESPYLWADVKNVPSTSIVNGSTMLLDKNGASLALVVALNVAPEYRERIALDITRALSAAGNPAKLRRFMNAARHGEEEAYAELAAANEIIAEARKFYLWVSETISKCAYNAEELEQGVKGWEPLADSIYNGTMASWRDTLGVEE